MTIETKRGSMFRNGGQGLQDIPGVEGAVFNPDTGDYEPKPAKHIQANGVANRQPIQRRRVPC